MDLKSGLAPTGGRGNDRRLQNWINSFTRLTESTESPDLFRKWTGISILGSVMERKVWTRPRQGPLYPNLYVVLVGPPGTGKSQIISQAEDLLRQVEDVHVAPSSVTTASLIDTLQLAECKIVKTYFLKYNSLQIAASELQNFLPAYEASFMGILTKLYDCELYEERRRTGKVNHIKIDFTQLSLLAGTTPSYLNQLLPEGAWDQGFTSRTIFVFAEKPKNTGVLFGEEEDLQQEQELYEDVLYDLRSVYELHGQIKWEDSTRDAIQRWVIGGEQPVPDHNRLLHYNSRRVAHLLKLCTIASISRSNEMQVIQEDLDSALSWLLEVESLMPEIFRRMTTTVESRSMEDAKFYLGQLHAKLKGPVPEHYLIDFLKHREKPQNIQKMIDIMIKSRMIKHQYDKDGNPSYLPI